MAPVRTEAVILQSFRYSETSKILRLLTRTHGVRSAIAKGALRPKSRFAGVLEPFTEGEATLYLKQTRDLQTLSEFELMASRQALGRDLRRFAGASLLAEVVLRTASEQAEPGLFEQLRRALDRIADEPAGRLEAAMLAEAWRLVARLGYAPALDSCRICGRGLEAEEDAYFDHAAGGARCTSCGPADPGRSLPAQARKTMLRFRAGESPELGRSAAHWRLLGRFLHYHVVEGRALRSLGFLTDTVER